MIVLKVIVVSCDLENINLHKLCVCVCLCMYVCDLSLSVGYGGFYRILGQHGTGFTQDLHP